MSVIDKLGEPLPQNVIVIRALPGLGDMLCAVPALRALRAALPEARITLLGLPWARVFVDRFNHYLDDLVKFPGFPGLPEVTPPIHHLPAFFSHMQQAGYDLALQMHGNGLNINAFTVLLGARLNAGFFLPGQYCPDESRFLPYPGRQPEVRRHLELMAFLGIPLQGEALEFPLAEPDRQARRDLAEAAGLTPGGYVCVHPGAQTRDKCWPADRFAAVADALAAQGLQVVLTGTAGEKDLTRTVAQAMRAPALDLAGRTSLGALGALLAEARLLVCNDTGVSHLAAALNVPSVVIFSNADPWRWAPLDQARHRIIYPFLDAGPSQCAAGLNSRCLRDDCAELRLERRRTAEVVSVAAVLELANNILEEVDDGIRQLV